MTSSTVQYMPEEQDQERRGVVDFDLLARARLLENQAPTSRRRKLQPGGSCQLASGLYRLRSCDFKNCMEEKGRCKTIGVKCQFNRDWGSIKGGEVCKHCICKYIEPPPK